MYYSSDYGQTYNYINQTANSYYQDKTYINEDGTIAFVSALVYSGYNNPLSVGFIDKNNLSNTTWTTITGVGSY